MKNEAKYGARQGAVRETGIMARQDLITGSRHVRAEYVTFVFWKLSAKLLKEKGAMK
jgi:hypothetical protein